MQATCNNHARCSFWVGLSSCSSDAAFLQRLPCCGDLETNPVRKPELVTTLRTDKPSNIQSLQESVGGVWQQKPGARESSADKW